MDSLILKYQEEYDHFNELVLSRNYDTLFKEYGELLRSIFSLEVSQSLENIIEDLEDVAPLDRDTVIMYLSALNGDTLMVDSFEGDVTEKLWEYIGVGVLDFDLQFTINDEDYFDDEYYVEDLVTTWNEVLKDVGKELYYTYNDDYSTGKYFIYIKSL
jgi:hypothetical protein